MDHHKNDEQLDKALKKTLGEKDIRSFRNAARQALEDVKNEAPGPKLGLVFTAFRIAAGIFVLVAAIWWWRSASSQPNALQMANELLAEYDSGIDPLDQALRGEEADETLPILWQDLDSLYKAANYQAVIEKLELIRQADPGFSEVSRSEWTFYLAMCQLHLGQNETALELLEQVQAPFSEKAAFFRAIALIRLDRQEESVTLLESLAASASESYKEAASRLLKELE